uniref:Methenyltetrahydrofolate synthase domain-containing protein-like n=1 Tax=Diabrotica virgifera virgifera TaxID=50390 RepID=A0A6P7H245_DIAVI
MEQTKLETNNTSVEKIKDLVLDEQETKLTIREKVWKYLISNKITNFPKPYRIPNFQEIEEASLKLLDLPAFKSAKSVEVLSDKPLASIRELVITNNKDLYVPILRSQKCFMRKLKLDEKTDTKTIVSSWGIHHIGEKVEVTGDIKFDIFVLGSVAVSKDGYRIGKGGGFVDLEFAIYKEMKAITEDTIIITIVHDSQVCNLFIT